MMAGNRQMNVQIMIISFARATSPLIARHKGDCTKMHGYYLYS